MKKVLSIILTCLALIMVSACGPAVPTTTTKTGPVVINSIQDLYDYGYTDASSLIVDCYAGILYWNEDHSDYYKVNFQMTEAQYDELEAIDFFADDYEEQIKAFYCKFTNAKIRHITDLIPSDEELSVWNGKKVKDMQDAGYEFHGSWMGGDSEYLVILENDTFALGLEINQKIEYSVDDDNWGIDALTDEEFSELPITSVSFSSFSDDFLIAK